MTTAAIRDVLKDDPSIFTEEQINYIGQHVVEAAKKVCGERLRGVILYGFYAHSDFRDWSDVDFMGWRTSAICTTRKKAASAVKFLLNYLTWTIV